MKVFYHHVAEPGLIDLPKTVFSRVSITAVEQGLQGHPLRDEIVQSLRAVFPNGDFNCWGTPAGAGNLIRQLVPGDAVVLAGKATPDGTVPALAIVKKFWPYKLEQLSQTLWGNGKYTYIFFFDTIELSLTWPEFITFVVDDLEYKSRPNGQFHKLKSERFLHSRFGSEGNFVTYLIDNFGNKKVPARSDLTEAEKADEAELDQQELAAAVSEIHDSSLLSTPTLTSGNTANISLVTRKLRLAAFRREVRAAYDNKCAICGSKLVSRTNQVEVQGAHIYPKHLDGSDDVRNGVCLCRLHHWALDAGWIAFSDEHTVLVHPDLPDMADYEFISQYRGTKIRLPADQQLVPHTLFLQAHRDYMGF